MSNALIVFVKNPVLGKVKTRLAETLGAEKALEIYEMLLTHTRTVCVAIDAEQFIYYSNFIDIADGWQNCKRYLQKGNDLGAKMSNAFAEVFALGNNNIVIIGSDCIEITPAIIQEAFDELDKHDVVIGPAADGGYYLLGMKQLHGHLFINKSWSTEVVLQQTLTDVASLSLSYKLLPVLNDIDDETDLDKIDLSFL